MRIGLIGIVWLVLVSIASGQSIELSGPSQPIEPQRPVQISVEGLAETEFSTANLTWQPKDDASAWFAAPLPLGSGQPFINFTPTRPGQYTIEVSVGNSGLARWREQVISSLIAVDKAIAGGTSAGAKPEIITALQAARKTLEDEAAKIEGRYGECTIQVGESPPPRPDPNPPDPTVNPYPAPPAEQRAAVEPITQVRLSAQHSKALGQIFSRAANTVKTNLARIAAGVSPEVGTTTQVQQQLKTEIVALGIQGEYAGLSDAVDNALTKLIGQASRPIQTADEAALLCVAWAMWEGGH